jgi:hypothetical protein
MRGPSGAAPLDVPSSISRSNMALGGGVRRTLQRVCCEIGFCLIARKNGFTLRFGP